MRDDDRAMEAGDGAILRLAAEIADGAAIHWPGVESSAHSDEERELVRELKILERLAEVHSHAAWHPSASSGSDARPRVARRLKGAAGSASEPQPEDRPDTAPATWGPLRLIERIGGGTFGDVYRAWDTRLDREVALKILHSRASLGVATETLPDSSVIEEGRLMARVRHSGVVTVHGAERLHDRVGLWMELIDGHTLAQEVSRRGPLCAREIQQIGVHLADALAAVHKAGVLHRDIKAQNVMRDSSGRTVLMDFGTGLELDDDAGTLAGTLLYLAPEVAAGGAATTSSDIYSFGVLLFFLATAAFPVTGQTLGTVRRAHARGERTAVLDLRADLPTPLAQVIERALSPRPEHRFADAAAMADALRQSIPEPSRLHPAVLGVAAITTVAAITGAGVWGTYRLGAPARPPGIVEEQIDPDLQKRVAIRGPAVGRLIPCSPRGAAGAAVCNLESGDVRILRKTAPGEFSPAMRQVLSPDGRWLAYQWWYRSGSEQVRTVNVVAVDGTGGHEVYRTSKGVDIQKWTQAGDGIVMREGMTTPEHRGMIVPAGGGPVTELARLTADDWASDLSPDGRTLLVGRRIGDQFDIHAIDVASGAEQWKLTDATNDAFPLWTPDGRAVIFISDRTGCESIMRMQIEDGRPADASIVLTDLGRNSAIPMGFSADRSYVVTLSHAWRTTFRAAIDLARGTVGAPRPQIFRCTEETMGTAWHPDGQRFAYVSGRRPAAVSPARIIIQAPDGRVERELAAPGRFSLFGRLRWSPDGRTLAAILFDEGNTNVLRLIDIESGHARQGPSPSRPGAALGDVRWDPSGAALYYREGNTISRFEIATSTITDIYTSADAVVGIAAGFDISPIDRSTVMLLDRKSGRCLVRIVPEAGPPVDRYVLDGDCMGVTWSRDGSAILAGTLPDRTARLWKLDRAAGDPVQLPIAADAFWDLALSPDESELLFAGGNPMPNVVMLKGIDRPLPR